MKRKKPEEMEDMQRFFDVRGANPEYSSPYTKAGGYKKVPDRPEIIGPVGSGFGNGDVLNLQNVPTTGSLNVSSTPAGAELYILNATGNEIDFGATPLTVTDIDPGSYNYIVRLSGYSDYNGSANIQAGIICCDLVNLQTQTKTEQCNAIPPTGPVIPSSQAGWVVIPEKDFYAGVGILIGVTIGLIVAYFILRKKGQ